MAENQKSYKIGLSTVSFLGALDVDPESKIRLLDFAAEIGVDWVEIRDSHGTLTLDDGLRILAFSKSVGLEVGYAIQAGLLDADFDEVFTRGLRTAKIFAGQGPRTLRILGSNEEFTADPDKLYWTDAELEQAAVIAGNAAEKCREAGLTLVIENAVESFFGKGVDQRGFPDLLDAVPDAGWQFDTANPFCGSRRPPAVEDLLQFIDSHGDRLAYLHTKTSVGGEAQETLTENPLPLTRIITAIESKKVNYLCIELAQNPSLEVCFENHKRSLETLRKTLA